MEITEKNSRKCSFCGEDINIHSRRCPYCGSLVSRMDTGENIFNDNINLQNEIPVPECGTIDDKNLMETAGEDCLPESGIQANGNSSDLTEKVVDFPPVQSVETTDQKMLSNGLKVFLVAISSIIPGIGQLAGLIIAIIFMNDEESQDKRSFGLALMISSLVVFAVSVFTCLLFAMVLSMIFGRNF